MESGTEAVTENNKLIDEAKKKCAPLRIGEAHIPYPTGGKSYPSDAGCPDKGVDGYFQRK